MKKRFLTEADKAVIVELHEAGDTLVEIVRKTGRHHSTVSQILKEADTVRPYKGKVMTRFTHEEIDVMREMASRGASSAEISKALGGRSRQSINAKLQSIGYDRSLTLSREQREIILRLKEEGRTVREIADIVGCSKSTAASIISLDNYRHKEPSDYRVIDGDVCRISSQNGKHEFLVSVSDMHKLPDSWIYMGANGYPVCRIDGKVAYLHHVIMGKPPRGYVVDHVNGVRTDCTKENLRFVTHQENTKNARRGVGKSGFMGVKEKGDGTFYAAIQLNLGTFETAEEAAKAYDEKAVEISGEFAMTNRRLGLL